MRKANIQTHRINGARVLSPQRLCSGASCDFDAASPHRKQKPVDATQAHDQGRAGELDHEMGNHIVIVYDVALVGRRHSDDLAETKRSGTRH